MTEPADILNGSGDASQTEPIGANRAERELDDALYYLHEAASHAQSGTLTWLAASGPRKNRSPRSFGPAHLHPDRSRRSSNP